MWSLILKYAAKLVVWVAEHPAEIDSAIEAAKTIREARKKKQ